eukprot:357485-Chlamydomonas_euryale.AAC.2
MERLRKACFSHCLLLLDACPTWLDPSGWLNTVGTVHGRQMQSPRRIRLNAVGTVNGRQAAAAVQNEASGLFIPPSLTPNILPHLQLPYATHRRADATAADTGEQLGCQLPLEQGLFHIRPVMAGTRGIARAPLCTSISLLGRHAEVARITHASSRLLAGGRRHSGRRFLPEVWREQEEGAGQQARAPHGSGHCRPVACAGAAAFGGTPVLCGTVKV